MQPLHRLLLQQQCLPLYLQEPVQNLLQKDVFQGDFQNLLYQEYILLYDMLSAKITYCPNIVNYISFNIKFQDFIIKKSVFTGFKVLI